MIVSEFQQALIGAGAAAVAGVWAYNRWQEYRYRKAAEKVFRGAQDDALVDAQQSSPEAGAEESTQLVGDVGGNERVEPRITPAAAKTGDSSTVIADDETPSTWNAAEPVTITQAAEETGLDSLIEAGVVLPPLVSVATLHAAWRAQHVEFRKSVRWVAKLNPADDWVEITDPPASRATAAHVAIQLADRQGVIDKNELLAFYAAAGTVAAAHGGDEISPEPDTVIARATALDEFCASVDIQIALHIVGRTGQSFAGSKLRGLLEACGLQLAPDGLFYLLDGDGGRLLSVCNAGAVPFDLEQMRTGSSSDVTFWLDVPRVSDGGAVFDIMLANARQLAGALDGVLVDDKRNPLADSVLAGIRAKVVELQAGMAAQNIPAGGRRALRLFA